MHGNARYNMASSQETLILLHANNKCADQPTHSRILISIFVIDFLESMLVKLVLCKISIVYLFSLAKQTGLGFTLVEILKTGFLASRPYSNIIYDLIKALCTQTIFKSHF